MSFRGYIVTAPNRLIPDRDEFVCVSFHNLERRQGISIQVTLSTYVPYYHWRRPTPGASNKTLQSLTAYISTTANGECLMVLCCVCLYYCVTLHRLGYVSCNIFNQIKCLWIVNVARLVRSWLVTLTVAHLVFVSGPIVLLQQRKVYMFTPFFDIFSRCFKKAWQLVYEGVGQSPVYDAHDIPWGTAHCMEMSFLPPWHLQ